MTQEVATYDIRPYENWKGVYDMHVHNHKITAQLAANEDVTNMMLREPLEIEFFRAQNASVTNVNFKKRSRDGEIVVSPHFRESTRLSFFDKKVFYKTYNAQIQAVSSYRGSDGKFHYTGCAFTFAAISQKNITFRDWAKRYMQMVYFDPSHRFDSVQNQNALYTSALAEANDGMYDLMTEYAEARKTLNYLRDTLLGALTALANIKYQLTKMVDIRKYPQTLADLWLQFHYALKPIILSAYDMREAIDSYESSIEYRKAIQSQMTSNSGYKPYSYNPQYEWIGTDVLNERVWLKRKYVQADMLRQLSLRIKVNPFNTAWELIPFSFVVDWFLNIGEYISAVTGDFGYAEQRVTYSRKRTTELRLLYKTQYSVGPLKKVIDEEVGSFSSKYYKRVIPSATPALNITADLSWQNYVTALALSLKPVTNYLKYGKRAQYEDV